MFFVLGRETWTKILTHKGPWEPFEAVAWSIWAAFATLAGLGIVRPLKMLPMVLLEIFYKVLWLILVAYPLWLRDELWGSPAEAITTPFLWVILPIFAVPWGYLFVNYIYRPGRSQDVRTGQGRNAVPFIPYAVECKACPVGQESSKCIVTYVFSITSRYRPGDYRDYR